MTTDVNWGFRDNGETPEAAAPGARRERPEPPALQIKTPAGRPQGTAAPSDDDASKLEFMLQRLMDRLEESERRYGEALDDLHGRLDDMSSRARSAHQSAEPEASPEIEAVSSRAAELAERLRQAEAGRRPQRQAGPLGEIEERISAFADQMARAHAAIPADPPAPSRDERSAAAPEPPLFRDPPRQAVPDEDEEDFGFEPEPAASSPRSGPPHPLPREDAPVDLLDMDDGDRMPPEEDHPQRLDTRFLDLTGRLEDTLEADPPAHAIEAMRTQVEDLSRDLGEALGESADGDALKAIEQRLTSLGSHFERAESHYQRVEHIEEQLLALVAMTRQAGDRIDTAAKKAAQETVRAWNESRESGGIAERLDAIQKELEALNERSREVDDRTVGTLEAMNETLKHVAGRVGLRSASAKAHDFRPEPGPVPPHYLDRTSATARAPGVDQTAPAAPPVASMPPTQEPTLPSPPAQPDAEQGPAPLAAEAPSPAWQAPRAPEQQRPRAEDDLVTAARRAAQAAAQRSQQQSARSSLLARIAAVGSEPASDAAAEERKPRRMLVFAALFLLVVSAALLISHLGKDEAPPPPAPALPQDSSPGPNSNPAPPTGSPGRAAEPGERAVTNAITDIVRTPVSLPRREAAAHDLTVEIIEPASARPADEDGQAAAVLPEAIGPAALRAAAANGDAAAQFEIGARYAAGKGVARNAAQAAHWYQRAAAQGLAPAQFRLASLYERGQGLAADRARAKIWYRRAAEQGNIAAMHNLAVLEAAREEGEPDYAAAAGWFAKAAAYGLADSQFNLGILHENGHGVAQNPVEAYKWFSLAGTAGDDEAAKRAKAVKLRLDAEALRAAEAAIGQWKPLPVVKAANVVPEPIGTGSAAVAPPAGGADTVARVQELLNALGYDAGPADGVIGPQTAAAIRAFEARVGLPASGRVSGELLARLQALGG